VARARAARARVARARVARARVARVATTVMTMMTTMMTMGVNVWKMIQVKTTETNLLLIHLGYLLIFLPHHQ